MRNPLNFARVLLYFSTGKTAWVATTDKHGNLCIAHLRPDTYRLDVRGWETTTIRLDPTLSKLSNEQVPNWAAQLMDNECLGYSEVVN